MTRGKSGTTLRALALVALVVGLAAARPEKRTTVTNVSLQEIGGATQLSFNADAAVQCTEVSTGDPTMIVLDMTGANHTLPRSAEMSTACMSGFRTDMWHTEDGTPVTRVIIALKGGARHWMENGPRGFTLMIEPAPAASAPGTAGETSDTGTWSHELPPAIDAMAVHAMDEAPVADESAGTAPGTEPAAPAAADGQSETWGEVSVEGTAPPAPVDPPAMDMNMSEEADLPEDAGSTPAAPETAAQDMATGTPDEEEMSPAHELMQMPRTFEPQVDEKHSLYADGGPRVSLDVQGADIGTVMRSLSEYSGVNIVVGRQVTGNVTVNLTEVAWLDALNMICRTQALGWVEEEGIIRVETLEILRKEEVERSMADKQMEDLQPLTTQIVRVVYATARELKPALEKTLTTRGHVEADHRTNSLVITDISKRVSAAAQMVKHLDSRTPQVEITAKLVDVDARYTRDLGIDWSLGQIHSTDQAASGELDIRADNVIDPAGRVRFGLVRSWGTINSMISALEQDNKADIISNPRITTVNNREARILVGRKIPLIVLDEAGNAVTQLTTIGITLRVTPHINDDNRITLDLHPEVSDLAAQATVQGGIIINTSEADTRVIVDDAETAVIGGLIRANTSKLKRGVPYLRDIPLLGHLFSGTTEVKEKRELLIFITPRVITSWAETH